MSKRARAKRSQAERSEATQQKIINSAVRILQRKGFQAATLQAIATGARVTLGAVQHHFSTRENLLTRLTDELFGPLGNHGPVWPPNGCDLPLPDRAREFVSLAWEHLYGKPGYIAAWSLFFGARSSAPKLSKRIEDLINAIDPVFFQKFLEVFPEVGARAANAMHTASFVFSTLRGIALLRLYEFSDEDLQGELDQLVFYIVAAGSFSPVTAKTVHD